MIHPTSAISVARLACCADDSTDQGSCRIRLPASVWATAGISYHKPVVVSIRCDDSRQPWRLLCVAALDSEEVALFSNPAPKPSPTPRTPQPLSPSPQTPATPAAVLAAVPSPPRQQQTPPATSQKQCPQSFRRCPVAAAVAVVDPTVVLPPPDRMLPQLRALLMQPTGPSAEVTACRGTAVLAAAEARVRVLPGQEHLVTPRMSFMLHQALVLPGCWVRMSPSCHVEVISVLPEPQFPDQPLRIVPSTRLVLVSHIGGVLPQEQQEQECTRQEPKRCRAGVGVEGDFDSAILPTDGSSEVATAPSRRSSTATSTSTSKTRTARKAGPLQKRNEGLLDGEQKPSSLDKASRQLSPDRLGQVHQQSSDMQVPVANKPGRGRVGELKLHSELTKSVPEAAFTEMHGLRDSTGGMWGDPCGSSGGGSAGGNIKSEAVPSFEGDHPPNVQGVEPFSVLECKTKSSAAGKYGRANVRQTTAKAAAGRNIGALKPCSSSKSTSTATAAIAAAVDAAAAAAVEPSQLELTAEGADKVDPDDIKGLVSHKPQGKVKTKAKAGSASGTGVRTAKSGLKAKSGNKDSTPGSFITSASLFDALRGLGDDD